MSAASYLHAVDDNGVEDNAQEPEGSSHAAPTVAPAASGATPPGGGSAANGASRVQKQRSDLSLPTDRLSHDKQVEALRSLAQLSGPSKRAVTAEDLSAAMGLKGHTGGLSNKFFKASGWVESAGRGAYAATDALLEFHRHFNITQDLDGACRYLAVPAQDSWYWEALEPILDGGLRKPMALLTLSKSAGAHDHTVQLELVLTWLEWLGLVRQEGGLIFRVAEGPAATPAVTVSAAEVGASLLDNLFPKQAVEDPATEEQQDQVEEPVKAPSPHPQSSPPKDEADTSALLSFNFSVRITAEDAASLSPEQLQSILDFAEKLRG